MLTKKQVEQAICWIDNNAIDFKILQHFVSENSNTVEQLISKYTVEYNNTYKKQLTSPMTKNIFMYLYDLCKKNPQTFYNCNININDDIVYSKKQEYFHIPQIIQNIQNENLQLLQENNLLKMRLRGLEEENIGYNEKVLDKERKSSTFVNEIINNNN
jgi:hypothetical protein